MPSPVRWKHSVLSLLGWLFAGCGTGDVMQGAVSDLAAGAPAQPPAREAYFSFFVTSLAAMQELSRSPSGFGGDLRFGMATGLEGADEICRQIAERAVPGSGQKGWHAFLSATKGGPNGEPVHAKDRIGDGPWFDRMGRLIASSKEDLLQPRPRGAHPAIQYDLPTEDGVPHHSDGRPDCIGTSCPDNHQVLTGTNEFGMLRSPDPEFTCNDWTSTERQGTPWCGHSWPRSDSGVNWMSATADGGCAPCVSLEDVGGVHSRCVGSAGGYGAIYCFALTP